MSTFDEVMARLTPAEDVVWLCLDAAAGARLRELEREFAAAPAVPTSLAERSPASAIAEQIEALRERMRGSEQAFRLRAMPGKDWLAFYARRPLRQANQSEEDWQEPWHTWLLEMVARTCHEPQMTQEQASQLADALNGADWAELSDACWALNTGKVSVPFSKAAYVLTGSSEQTSRRQPASASPSANGSAPSRARSRRTNTTTKAG